MASRPHVPNISTNTPRDYVNTGRLAADKTEPFNNTIIPKVQTQYDTFIDILFSPHAPTPVMYSPSLGDSASSRIGLGKRPLDSHARGESPPEKRTRPPGSRSALQDRHAHSKGSRIPSPPPSRKSSFAGLTNAPTGPRLASDQFRPESPQYQRRENGRVLFPSSIGSGSSTPTHHAPPAPSMVPVADASTLPRSADVTSSTTETTPITMQVLRRLKERKRAIAHQMTASVSKTVEAKLTTQAMDIAYLKKERGQIIKNQEERNSTAHRLDEIEAMAAQFPSLMNRTETLELVNVAAKSLAGRLEVLERSATELPNVHKGLQDLASVSDRLDALKSRSTVVEPKPEPNQLNVLENPKLNSLTDRVNSLEAADGALAKITSMENDIITLKNAKELHNIAINTLNTWKDAQTNTVSEGTIKNLVTTEVEEKVSSLHGKADEVNRLLAERITRNETSISDIQIQSQSFQSFQEIKEQKLTDQLSALHGRLRQLETNDAKTYSKADKLQTRLGVLKDKVDELDRLTPWDANKIRDRLDKLEDMEEKLFDKVKAIRDDINGTNKDLSALGKAFKEYQGDVINFVGRIKGDSKDTGFSLSERVASLRTTVTLAELGRLPVHLGELEESARNLNDLTLCVDELGKLPARVQELEKGVKGPSFRRVGTPVFPSSAPKAAPTGDLNQKVDSLDKSLQQLRKEVIDTNSLTSRINSRDERINHVEPASASARPLDSVEQTAETTGDKALDKAVEKTAEKATEKKVKTLASTERTFVERNLAEAKTRLIEMIRASRNQPHESRVASADATTAPSAQFDANALNDIQRDLETLFEKLETLSGKSEYHDGALSSLSDFVPNLFREHFDPFKTLVEQQLQTTSNTLDKYGHDLSHLTQQAANPPTQQNSFGEQQQAQLDAMVAEAATLKTDFAALKASVTTKADAETIHQHMQGFTFALNNLESRYNNISTDDIYKGMVEWFTHMYPSFTQILEDVSQLKAVKTWVDHRANFITGLSQNAEHLYGLLRVATELQELANITLQVKSLVNKGPQLESLANSTMPLQSLINNAPQLESLVRSNDASPQTLAKIEQACSYAQMATAKAEQASADASTAIMKAEQASSDAMTANVKAEQAASEAQTANIKNAEIEQRLMEEVNTLEKLSVAVTGIQTSLRNFNSDKAPFAGAAMVEALKTRLHELSSDDSPFARADVVKTLRSDYDATVSQIWGKFGDVQGAGVELRKDFDATVSKYIEPNRDFFGLLGTALMVISQLQQVVENLNQNLPVAPLKLEWQCYLPTLGQPETNGEPSNSKGKGKSKQ
ncbi:hypothetical protein G6011_00834 [Alternaria panax]|uniref:Uncharacterized protein n=1 Tax=Alternaria panax TaxID=48097 RepID=A0AAD4NVB7_9PLEO|nr:hypothetical protein G6011_00834 [Alternaria panax]